MKVIVPVAGVGNRLKPHTDSRPKPLLEVGGRTILDHVLKPLDGLDLDEVIFVIGHLGNQIADYVRTNYSFKANFVEQDKLLGLGYAVNVAMQEVTDGPVLIILGDTVVACDLSEFVAAGEYVLGVHKVPDPERFGVVETENGIVTAVVEKPPQPKTDLALIGLYYCAESAMLKEELSRLVQSGRTTSGEIQLTDALASMIERGVNFVAHPVPHWYDCGKKETLLSSNQYLLKKMNESSPKVGNSRFISPIFVDDTAVVSNSTLGPFVSVGAKANISGCTISNSIVSSDAVLENTVIKDSLIGPKAIVRNFEGVLNIGEKTEIDGAG